MNLISLQPAPNGPPDYLSLLAERKRFEAAFHVDCCWQNEVSMLKNEVTQLKQLLLTHKDCPITAMQKESQGYLSECCTHLASDGTYDSTYHIRLLTVHSGDRAKTNPV